METKSVTTIREKIKKFPRVNLAFIPTPLHKLQRLSDYLNGPSIYIKRDDLTGLAFGGNKTRGLEFLMADALVKKSDTIILSAAVQSNMLRQTCAAARQLGLDIHLVVRGGGNEVVQGNLLLDHLFGADITFIQTKDPYSQLSLDVMTQIATDLRIRGRHPYIIDVRYHSAPLASIAYVLAAVEIHEQIEEQHISNPVVICPVSSGTTLAGIILGRELLKNRFRVIGISVQQLAKKMVPIIFNKVNAAAELIGVDVTLDKDHIEVHDRWIGLEYGIPTPECIDAIQLTARKEGIVLDPVYTAKAFSGLIGLIQGGDIEASNSVIFIHTGGTPNLFAYADQLVPYFLSKDRKRRIP